MALAHHAEVPTANHSMKISLIVKELRQLWPIGLLWFGLDVISWLTDLFSKRIDEQSLGNWCSEMCDPGISTGIAAVYIVFGLITAYSLYPREHDDGTINFLRALPVSRFDIFASKLLAAVFLLVTVTTISSVLIHLVLLTNPESLRGGHYPSISLPMMISDALILFIIIAYGLFLSTMRIVGLVVFAAYFVLLLWLETQWQFSGPWNLTEIFRIQYFGQTLLLPWKALLMQSGIALVLLALSYRIWSRADSHSAQSGPGQGRRRWLNVAATIIIFGLVSLIGIGNLAKQSLGLGDETTRTIESTHYRFVYFEPLEQRALTLREHADNIYEALVKTLNTTNQPTIRANLTASSQHFAGQAAWKTLRMDISGVRDAEYFRHVLAHETAHVFQATESNRKLRDHFNSVRFFVEGSAEHLAFTVLPSPDRRNRNWVTAATAASRLKIDFEDMVDSTHFAKKFDPDLFYALGDMWASALARVCGPESIGNSLRAFARPDAPPDLAGVALWQDNLQAIGCELTDVNVQWKQSIRSLGEEGASARFPEFSTIVVTPLDQSSIAIRADLKASGKKPTQSPDLWPGSFNIRVKRQSGLAAEPNSVYPGRLLPLSGVPGRSTVEFIVPRHILGTGRFDYQLGYNPPDTHASIYERWRSAPSDPD